MSEATAGIPPGMIPTPNPRKLPRAMGRADRFQSLSVGRRLLGVSSTDPCASRFSML